VVVDRDREALLGHVLANHVLIEELLHLAWCGDFAQPGGGAGNATAFLLENILAQVGAVRADVDAARSFNHGPNFAAGLAAE